MEAFNYAEEFTNSPLAYGSYILVCFKLDHFLWVSENFIEQETSLIPLSIFFPVEQREK